MIQTELKGGCHFEAEAGVAQIEGDKNAASDFRSLAASSSGGGWIFNRDKPYA